MELNEKKLIQDILGGDKAAFKKLYDIHFNQGMRTAIAITRDREVAKDALQETFIRVYRNLSSYDESQPFEPWFYRILINECNRLLKKEAKIKQLVQAQKTEVNSSNSPKEEYDDLYEAIQSLKDMYRHPLILKYLKGFTERDIATCLEINVNTIKTRLLKGREKLRKLLNEKRGGQHV
ncbi:RNA polymerase sigma factor [Peribacillus huizhouensis]|uniref:RNA polymerase sigma-70 factor (ECF subfamily) n=1 Tax=Peribacillus huizhouensis TaxID=1501239 RepID=A0ABR6CLU9_9BACI|nr:sigma-70 family RNA polymerase sigma factor [Peribacillus huizhouensis]MBA9025686.1 RNA polymerase sigma-70 factor (ECF subfamily) [Peribacillus huizhouensis]